MRAWVIPGLIVLLTWLPCSQQAYPQSWPDVQPEHYQSASGRYRWQIDPSTRSGAGEATYSLHGPNGLLQEVTLPFTLLQAGVDDAGSLFGYGYTEGLQPTVDRSKLLVVRVGTDAGVQVLLEVPRVDSRGLHTAPEPDVLDLIFDPDNDRMILRVTQSEDDRGPESWWSFQLSTGVPGERQHPKGAFADDATLRVMAARPLKGTNQMLVHLYTRCSGSAGARFALLDPAMAVSWSLDWADDYSRGRDRSEQVRLIQSFDQSGAILGVPGDGRFALWSAASGQRVELQWVDGEVQELSRTLWKPETPVSAKPPVRQLHPLGAIELSSNETEAALDWGDLIDFDIDDRGRFGMLDRSHRDGSQRLMRINAAGQVDQRFALDSERGAWPDARLIWIAGDRWLLTRSLDQKRAIAEWIDFGSGKRTPVKEFESPPIIALARASEGGFVALTQLFEGYTIIGALRAFSAEGRPLWTVGENYGDQTQLFGAVDVSVRENGDVVVLENAGKQLKHYDQHGQYLGTTSLAEAWGREPNYPTSLSTIDAGAVIVHDFGGKPSVVRMDGDAQVSAGFTPQHPNGQRFRLQGHLRQGIDGKLWANDGSTLLRLDGDGRVEHIVGPRAEPNRLGEIATMLVSRQGQIYAVDDRTGAAHVFAANGAPLMLCAPEPTDYSDEIGRPGMGLADNGTLFVGRQNHPADVLQYDAQCQRVGIRKLKGLITHFDHWLPQPGSDRHWVIGSGEIYLVDDGGRIQRTIERSAANRWLDSLRMSASGADGSLLVATESSAMFVDARYLKPAFARFAADGEALSVWPTPDGLDTYANLAYDGVRSAYLVATGDRNEPEREVWVGDENGRPRFRFQPANPPEQLFLVEIGGSSELWLYSGGRRLDRYNLDL